MEIVDSNWLKMRLRATGATQVRLAAAMKLTPDKLAKILAGKRRVTAEEAAYAKEFFDEDDLTPEEEQLLEAWRDADPDRRKAAVELLLFLANRGESEAGEP